MSENSTTSKDIIIKDIHEFSVEELEDLFLSVKWSSGHFPEKLQIAMQNYETVYSAWDDEKLVGMVCAMDDGIMTAYVHYLLVRPDYQGRGIGKKLISKIKEHYKNYLRIVLVAYNKEISFYERCGFKVENEERPMCITELWT